MAKPENFASNKKIVERAEKLYQQIESGYTEEKKEQTRNIEEYWKVYNCELGDDQQYNGDSQIYEPITRDALEARRKRFTAMLFPSVGENIECISEQGDIPQATLAMQQYYVRKMDLRAMASMLFLNGDVEGQYSVMLDWVRKEREITVKKSTLIDDSTEEIPSIEKEIVVDEMPEVTIIAAQDLWFFPSTITDIQDAEIVSVALRLTDDALDDMVERGLLLKKPVDQLVKSAGTDQSKWAARARTAEAGVKIKAGQKFTLIYQVFTRLKIEDKKVPVIIFYGGESDILGIIKNPYWSQKIPIITEPVDKVAGTLWGKSRVAPVAPLQYQLNDICNMGMDSAMYTLLPIVMTDPLKNPKTGSMVMAAAAIWETSPADTNIVDFPPLYQHALTLRGSIKQQIMESMDVNETMLGVAPQGRKNAAAVGQQSAEGMATIGDVVKRFENGVMNQILQWNYELDLQYREEDLMIVQQGEHGVKAILERIPPQQVSTRYWFKWLGADQAMGAQRVQQMIGFMNVLRGIPPEQLNGRKLDIGPILDFASEAVFGPTLAQNILIDQRHMMSLPPEIENEILHNNLPAHVSPDDDDLYHLQSHQAAAALTGDRYGGFRVHIMEHMQSMQRKQMEQQPKGQPGIPGGMGLAGGPQAGVAGTPRPGSMPAEQRVVQNPPGAINPDQMQDGMAGMRG